MNDLSNMETVNLETFGKTKEIVIIPEKTELELLVIEKDSVMSLMEISKLLGMDHNKVMKVVDNLSKATEFDVVVKSTTTQNTGIGEREIKTYDLSKRQSIAVASRISTPFLMKMIDRWSSLEEKILELTQLQLQEAEYIIETKASKFIPLSESAEILETTVEELISILKANQCIHINTVRALGVSILDKGRPEHDMVNGVDFWRAEFIEGLFLDSEWYTTSEEDKLKDTTIRGDKFREYVKQRTADNEERDRASRSARYKSYKRTVEYGYPDNSDNDHLISDWDYDKLAGYE